MDNSIVRGALLLGAGVFLGIVIGLAISSPHHSDPRAAQGVAGNSASATTVKVRPGSHLEAGLEHPNIVLGDIVTVPFQELYGLLSTLSPEQLNELAAQLKTMPAGKDSNAKVAAFFKAWSHFDPIAALHAAATFKVSEAKTTAVESIVASADATQAKNLAKEIQEWPPEAVNREQRNGFLNSLLMKWSDLDPVEAAKFFDAIQVDARRYQPVASLIAQNWAAMDPTAALEWARAHSDAQGFQAPMYGAINGWWSKDHTAAEQYVAAHSNDFSGRQMATTLTRYIFSKDPERSKEWVAQLPDLETRRQAQYVVIFQMAANDPKSASDYAAALPADVREGTLTSAINYWASNSLTAAGEWIKGLSGPARDEALGAYTYNLLRKDPNAAAAWAVTISDPKIRDKSLNGIATFWLNKDPAAASAWIQNSGLPAADKKRLLGLPPSG
jgi:hypothetical protein